MALAVLWIWPQIHDPGFEPLTHTPSAVLIYKNGVSSVLSLVPSKLMKLPASSHHTVFSILLLWNVAGKMWRPFHGSNKNIKISCFSSSGWRKRKAGETCPPWCYWYLGLDSSSSWGASCPCWLLSSIPVPHTPIWMPVVLTKLWQPHCLQTLSNASPGGEGRREVRWKSPLCDNKLRGFS